MIAHPSSTDGADGWQSVEALFGDFAEVCLHEARGEEEEKGGGSLKKKKKSSLQRCHLGAGLSALPPAAGTGAAVDTPRFQGGVPSLVARSVPVFRSVPRL